MTRVLPAGFVRSSLALVVAAVVVGTPARRAHAQDPTPPAGAAPAAAPVALAPAPVAVTAAMPLAPSVEAPKAASATDHDKILGHWGLEAREIAKLQRTPGQDGACKDNCPVAVNALGVRRWYQPDRAWSAGLAFAIGGGSSSVGGKTLTWDTYMGVGPTVGMSFLVANWKHLAVSASPQLDTLFFMPGGTRSKTLLVNARGLVEGELHLGFIGLPAASLGLSSGVVLAFKAVTKPGDDFNTTKTANEWSFGPTGPQSLWGLVTNMYLRFYF